MYTFALYLHFIALLLAFFATGLAVAGDLALRRAATIGDARFAVGLLMRSGKMHPAAALGLLLTGAFLTQSEWSWTTPWILCGIAGLVIVGAAGGGVVGGRERALERALSDAVDGPILPPLRERLNDPVVRAAGPAISCFVLGIMFLMVMKPAWPGSLLTLAVAAVAGIALGLRTQATRKANPRVVPAVTEV